MKRAGMKISGGEAENGVVIGNVFDKYGSRNPLVRLIMRGFGSALDELVYRVAPGTINEVGCGEGFWVLRWNEQGFAARGCDFSSQVIALAQGNAVRHGMSPDLFERRSIYELDPQRDSADLVVCCEVLEHLDRPKDALQALQKTVRRNLIVSVPREPLWRVLNVARGKYLSDWGNTPGHVQHWSRYGFVGLIEQYFEIVEVRSPLPWTMLLCRARG